MLAIKANEVRDNFKGVCDLVIGGETIIVSRPHNQNVVVLSEREFNILEKAFRNMQYMIKIDESIKQASEGKVVIKTMEELEEMAK